MLAGDLGERYRDAIDEAQSLGALLDGKRRALETAELERRLAALETRFALTEEI